jgi:hypothetical protein
MLFLSDPLQTPRIVTSLSPFFLVVLIIAMWIATRIVDQAKRLTKTPACVIIFMSHHVMNSEDYLSVLCHEVGLFAKGSA